MNEFVINGSARDTFAAMESILDLWCTPKETYDSFRYELLDGVLDSRKSANDVYQDLRGVFLTAFQMSDRVYTPGFLNEERMTATREFVEAVRKSKVMGVEVFRTTRAYRTVSVTTTV